MLFNRGKAISGAPIIIGINQFPNPPIIIGITIKKIIINAWDVTITLYVWSFSIIDPGILNSNRIIELIAIPVIPDHNPNMKYRVPISLWLVEKIHLFSKLLSKVAEVRR